MGELGFLTPNNRRTVTVECIEDGQVLTITYERLLEIYFQNPQFGYYFLVLTSQTPPGKHLTAGSNSRQEKAARQTASRGWHGLNLALNAVISLPATALRPQKSEQVR